jgi:hypothetical protein
MTSGRSLAVVAQLTTASLAHDKLDACQTNTGSTFRLRGLPMPAIAVSPLVILADVSRMN